MVYFFDDHWGYGGRVLEMLEHDVAHGRHVLDDAHDAGRRVGCDVGASPAKRIVDDDPPGRAGRTPSKQAQ